MVNVDPALSDLVDMTISWDRSRFANLHDEFMRPVSKMAISASPCPETKQNGEQSDGLSKKERIVTRQSSQIQ